MADPMGREETLRVDEDGTHYSVWHLRDGRALRKGQDFSVKHPLTGRPLRLTFIEAFKSSAYPRALLTLEGVDAEGTHWQALDEDVITVHRAVRS